MNEAELCPICGGRMKYIGQEFDMLDCTVIEVWECENCFYRDELVVDEVDDEECEEFWGYDEDDLGGF